MAEEKTTKLEREYVVPLRRYWIRYPAYMRGGKAIKALKVFIARHMRVEERNLDNVKIDMYLNNEILFRGRKTPPSKVKVKAIKEGNIVKVELAEVPQHVRFLKLKHSKIHQASTKKPEAPKEEKKAEEKTEEQKTEEKEKEKSVAEAGAKQAEQKAKVEKHVTKSQKAQRPQRMALQK